MNTLSAGTIMLAADGRSFAVPETLAATFQAGDRLIADPVAGLLHIPGRELDRAKQAVDVASAAFSAMHRVADEAIVAFYGHAAAALADHAVWTEIATVNAEDVAKAAGRGRSTTRLAVSAAMREKMIDGLRRWAQMPSRRGALLETVHHDGFDIELVGAALGVVAFVFEGRPNVLADACGVLRGGNAVVFRIGSDALATARAIMRLAIEPALLAAGLPAGAVALVDSTAHAAGWALFADARLALAVARGSGAAVATLGGIARTAGTPVSLHGTGGAWMVVSEHADDADLHEAVLRSLDRKVCNTLNTCCLVGSRNARHRAEIVLNALREASAVHQQPFKLHVAKGSERLVPPWMFTNTIRVARATGPAAEPQAEPIDEHDLGVEWEWERTPEISLAAAETLDQAVALFNALSPRLVGSLISSAAAEHERFFAALDAPFVGDGHTRWVDGQYALNKPELGLSNWQHGRLFGRAGVLTGDSVYTIRTRHRRAVA